MFPGRKGGREREREATAARIHRKRNPPQSIYVVRQTAWQPFAVNFGDCFAYRLRSVVADRLSTGVCGIMHLPFALLTPPRSPVFCRRRSVDFLSGPLRSRCVCARSESTAATYVVSFFIFHCVTASASNQPERPPTQSHQKKHPASTPLADRRGQMKRPRSLRGRGNNTTVKPSYLLVNFCCKSETAVSLFQKADIILVLPHS